ncbi:Eco57I restriction-modification methylase domain-containing protein [candidate division KSB1 bacterium]|nr:Eco57I restriction-modification methylase domain-containing protein [candidate division KSB1 bacterium]
MKNQKDTIHSLVEKFQHNLNEYKNPKYNETHIRVEFVNPFWEALGWDVHNKAGYSMQYRDVIHEDEVKVGGTTKAPDYSFRIGGKRIFFMETKKPSIDLKHDPAPAFQLRRYAYSARLPVSILTDFEEFILYDTRVKPAITDKPHVGRMLYYTFDEYAKHWDEIQSIFSKEAVMRGDFQKFIENNQGKKARAEIDRDFLNDLDSWRVQLARNIALRNPGLSERELNYVVQLTIDRLIFLRMCEDRGIESQYPLRNIQNGENVYPRLVEIYYRADERYNSGLFHFEAKDGSHPDVITPHLKMDDKILKEILAYLYYPKCPYEFSVLPVEVLGNAYEQFLGKRITLTEGHRARIEEKPEVRKAGGVYYTPQYIVEYIVRNTVGKLVEGKTPKEVSDLRICDPACGSGSFLLGAYQFLLDWHLEQYRIEFEATGQFPSSPPAKGQRARKSDPQAIYQGAGGAWYLSTTEKKRILLSNIYGVDIDANAVEVTKLSLLLKVLEGENAESLHSQMKLWHERALPNLSSNIKCGNSLIGPDFYEHQQGSLFDENEAMRINAFDWKAEFSEVFANGGFDAVIGNPPYIRIQAMKEWAPVEVEFYKQKYKSASKGNYDIYVVFVERGLTLLNQDGLLGFILPHKFFNAKYGEPLRNILSQGNNIERIVHFGDNQIFNNATTYTCLLFLNRNLSAEFNYIEVDNVDEWLMGDEGFQELKSQETFSGNEWHFIIGKGNQLFEKLNSTNIKLSDVSDRIYQGLITGADSVFILTDVAKNRFFSDARQKEYKLESKLLHPLCKGSVNLKRYFVKNLEKSILFPYKYVAGKAELISKTELQNNYPNTWKYLIENRAALESREHGKWKHDRWYAFGRSQNLSEMEQLKIMTPSIAIRASFSIDEKKDLFFVGSGGGGGGGYGIIVKPGFEYYQILALLNSKLIDWYIKQISTPFSGGYFAYNRQYIEKIPIVEIALDKQKNIVTCVNQILDLHKKLAEAREPRTCETLQRQIDAVDAQIDKLVYELYGLTVEEVRVVEGG